MCNPRASEEPGTNKLKALFQKNKGSGFSPGTLCCYSGLVAGFVTGAALKPPDKADCCSRFVKKHIPVGTLHVPGPPYLTTHRRQSPQLDRPHPFFNCSQNSYDCQFSSPSTGIPPAIGALMMFHLTANRIGSQSAEIPNDG